MAAEKEDRAERFKRILGTAMKTIAEDPELSVTFGNDQPTLIGNRAKLPQVNNQIAAREIAITRGLADSFALRVSNHSDQIHSHYQPVGKNARAVFESVEQARVEALGANAMPGMALNLTAMLDERYSKTVVNRSSNRKDTPLEEAVALIVREKLTGLKPPASVASYVDLWRPWVEQKAADQLNTLGASIHDQAAFARLSRDVIAALDMADELGDDPDKSDENEEQDSEEDGGQREESPEGEEQESQQSAAEELEDSEGDADASEMDAQQMDVEDTPDDADGQEHHARSTRADLRHEQAVASQLAEHRTPVRER